MGRGEERVRISHLFFVDDALIFCEPTVNAMLHLKCIILCFQMVSGLKINMRKTKLVRIGYRGEEESLALVLGRKTTTFPIKYLGLPLGAKLFF